MGLVRNHEEFLRILYEFQSILTVVLELSLAPHNHKKRSQRNERVETKSIVKWPSSPSFVAVPDSTNGGENLLKCDSSLRSPEMPLACLAVHPLASPEADEQNWAGNPLSRRFDPMQLQLAASQDVEIGSPFGQALVSHDTCVDGTYSGNGLNPQVRLSCSTDVVHPIRSLSTPSILIRKVTTALISSTRCAGSPYRGSPSLPPR